VIKVGIVGGTGYTGAELLRVLCLHPEVEVTVITSRAESGKPVSEHFPSLRGRIDLAFSVPNSDVLLACDLIFFATPHGVAQSMMAELIGAGKRVIDLSADFRIKDIALWEHWYKQAHQCPELVDLAVYGLPEVNREHIKQAQLIACPGCYPTSVQLGLLPALRSGKVDANNIIVNAASGISGAGRNANTALLMAENYDNFRAYGVAGHRHLPEIEQGLAAILNSTAERVNVTFVPHLLPTIRGILSTIYIRLSEDLDMQKLYEDAYADEPFVDVLPKGRYPETRFVKGTNRCQISLENPLDRGQWVIMAAEDNLAKGASTQAIQNMNLMFGFDEACGLDQIALLP
jgi:N-acetyl-gamma-glutamyl-phosphate reductase